jgi:hypothetical protein
MNKHIIAFIIFSISSLLTLAEDKPLGDTKAGLVIVNAIYRSVGSQHRTIDVTRVLRKALRSGEATIKLNTAYLADGVDPARRMPKETLITYTIDGGEQKKKTFPDNQVLNFREDLN